MLRPVDLGRSRSQAGARPVSQPPTPGAGPLTVMVKMYSTKFHKGLLESAPKHSLGCRQLRRQKKKAPHGRGLSLRACVGLNWDALGIEDRGGGRPTIKRALAGRASVWRQLKRATVRFKRGH